MRAIDPTKFPNTTLELSPILRDRIMARSCAIRLSEGQRPRHSVGFTVMRALVIATMGQS